MALYERTYIIQFILVETVASLIYSYDILYFAPFLCYGHILMPSFVVIILTQPWSYTIVSISPQQHVPVHTYAGLWWCLLLVSLGVQLSPNLGSHARQWKLEMHPYTFLLPGVIGEKCLVTGSLFCYLASSNLGIMHFRLHMVVWDWDQPIKSYSQLKVTLCYVEYNLDPNQHSWSGL